MFSFSVRCIIMVVKHLMMYKSGNRSAFGIGEISSGFTYYGRLAFMHGPISLFLIFFGEGSRITYSIMASTL